MVNMQKTKFARIKAFAPLLLIAVIIPLFFVGGPTLESTRLFGALWNCGHILFFGLLVIQLNKKYPLTTLRSGLILTLVVFVVGGLIELIQVNIGRDGNWKDVYLDLAGTWIGLVWLLPVNRWIWCARIAVLSLAVPSLMQVVLFAVLHFHAAREFPRIADFESPLDLYEFSRKFERTEEFHTHGRYGLKLTLTPALYSGISINRAYADWSPYKQLNVDIYNPSTDPLGLVIRVNDIAHDVGGWKDDDRFNQSIQLKLGWNYISIPISIIKNAPAHRLMDMSKVSSIIIYTSNLPVSRVIYVDNLRLD